MPKPLKTAVCLYAFLRTYEDTAASLIKNILIPNDADLFIFAPNVPGISVIPAGVNQTDGRKMDKAKYGNVEWSQKMDEIGEKITNLAQIYGSALKDSFSYEYDREIFDEASKGIISYGTIPASRIFSIFYNMKGAIELCMNYARKNDIEYESIILTRGDIGFYSPIVCSGLDLNKIHIPAGGGVLRNPHSQWFALYYKNVYRGEIMDTRPFTDLLLVSSYSIMTEIASIYGQLRKLSEQVLPMHSETLINYVIAYKHNRDVIMHKEWIFEVCRSDFARIENIYARYPPIEQVRDIQIAAGKALMGMKYGMKHRIKTIAKFVFYPLKKIVIWTKHFCGWLAKE
jgi:hypothetical protein